MKTKSITEKNIKVCLVGSSGGHLTHLYMLKPFWKDKNRFWVTFDKEDARSLLEGEKVYILLKNKGFDTIARKNMNQKQTGRYDAYNLTYGNRPELFGAGCSSFAPGQLGASFSLVLPMLLPPEVAKGIIVLPFGL